MNTSQNTPQSEIWLACLQENGYRLTLPRRTIVEILASSTRALDPLELYDLGRRVYPRLGLVTVYRTLELLAGLGFVKCITTGHKERLWEFLGSEQPHPHLLCRACGELSGFDESEIASLREYLFAQYGFTPSLAQLTIPGLCRRCRAQAGGVEV